ncbi:tRNA (guanosine(46)-N7)-methyltransferase TrmB [Parafilimonas sp.]|uniref:tRNA (guanosine(46)-N7)-methyltransferase TrmB n=1 Tax=Parafilimonas sp. TaxID=1969739 RepID=UPI0039E4A71D
MAQKKLIRFAELETFPNVLQYPQNMRGNWHAFFKNNNPITLELACGKGEYAVGLGRLYAERNFVGIDVKGNRIWKGAKTALTEGLKNTAFLRTQIDKLEDYFTAGEVSEIWITFPDPQLRFSKMKKRLTHPKFLRLYQNILQKDGIVHLKTDSPDLYIFTKAVIDLYELKIIADKGDLYKETGLSDELTIKTYYESLDIAQSNKVHYLAFTLSAFLPKEKDEQLKALFREQALN